MDPVAHTLVGATLSAAGLGRRTPLATATLVIGANLPDVDVAAYAWGEPAALAFRRGWTHGVLALAVWPIVLAGFMLFWDRAVRRARTPQAAAVSAPALLPLAAIAVASHPLLDLLNVYGVRLLMPFDDRWLYGDVLFIVDPWFWVILVTGLVLARRGGSRRPARVALVGLGGYVGLMALGAAAVRHEVLALVPSDRPVGRAMIGPEPLTPFRRWIVLDQGDRLRVGRYDWLARPRVRYADLAEIRRGAGNPAVGEVAGRRRARQFLSWARFPFFQVTRTDRGRRVAIIDARYALEAGARFGALTLEVPD